MLINNSQLYLKGEFDIENIVRPNYMFLLNVILCFFSVQDFKC